MNKKSERGGNMSNRPGAEEATPNLLEQFDEIKRWVAKAAKIRWFLIVSLTLTVSGVLAVGTYGLPETYTAHGRILAQSHIQLPILANPRRAIPFTADAPTRSVGPMVLSERNLKRLIEETDLLVRWKEQRLPLQVIVDTWLEKLFGAPTEEERLEALIDLLRRKVIVYSEDEVVNFLVSWYDQDTPVLLVEHLQELLLHERRKRENGVISDALEILQAHGQEVRLEIDRRLEELNSLRAKKREERPKPKTPVVANRPAVSSTRSREVNHHIAELRAELDHALRTHREIESQRQRRMIDLQSTLRQRSVELGPEHPDILGLEYQVEALRKPSAEEEHLRIRTENLRARYLRLGGDVEGLQDTSPRSVARQRLAGVIRELEEDSDEDDEELAYARAQLSLSIAKYEDILERIGSARIELDTSNAAFKYRYTVIAEPRRPRDANGLPKPLVVIGGLFLGLAFGFSSGVARELLAARILEPWQVDRFVGVPLIGVVGVERR